MVKVSVLASSSSGNSALVSTARTSVLIDVGLSRKEIYKRIAELGEDRKRISAILITHEHSDHVAGLHTIAKDLDIPIYVSQLTAPVLFGPGSVWAESKGSENYQPKIEHFAAGSQFTIGDIDVTSFTIPHDAIDPVGFSLRAEGVKISIATDLGYMPDSIRFHLRGSDVLLLESNHDLELLKVGPYPWALKQRIMGRNGHLSNDVACTFIREQLDSTTSTLILGHLSTQNNFPALARIGAEQALESRGLCPQLVIAGPEKPTESFVY